MRYWIIVDDRHAGPFSAQQLLDTGLTPDTLVWTEGMPDWTRAANVAELADGLRLRAQAEAEARGRLVAESDAENARLEAERRQAAQEAPAQEEYPVDCTVTGTEVTETYREPECATQCEAAYAAPGYGDAPAAQPQQPAQPSAAIPAEPCPPAYIAWSIIATLVCCTIVGIPAIIFASMTKSAYYKGDLAKAKRYSELAQWFIIAAITLGAIGWPFQMAFMSMFQ